MAALFHTVFLQPFRYLASGLGSDNHCGFLSLLEQHQRGDGLHRVFFRKLRLIVNIDFADHKTAFISSVKLIYHRA